MKGKYVLYRDQKYKVKNTRVDIINGQPVEMYQLDNKKFNMWINSKYAIAL